MKYVLEVVVDEKGAITGIERLGDSTEEAKLKFKQLNETIQEQEKITADFRIELGRLKEEFNRVGGSSTIAGLAIEKRMLSLKTAINDNVQSVKKLKIDKAQTQEVVNELKLQEKAAKLLGDEIKETSINGFSILKKISPKAAKALIGVKDSINILSIGFKTLRMAIISTGIGALVVALTSVVLFFTQTKRGAELLGQATAGLGAIFSVLTNTLSKLGEYLVKAFQDPQKTLKDLGKFLVNNITNRLTAIYDQAIAVKDVLVAAFTLDWDGLKKGAENLGTAIVQAGTGLDKGQQKALADSFKDVGEQMLFAAQQAVALKKAEQDLEDATRDLNVERSAANLQISKYRLLSQDVTNSFEDRIEASKKANQLELDLAAKELKNAEEKVRILSEQHELKKEDKELTNQLAEAQIELNGVQNSSYKLQRTLVEEVNDIKKERDAEYTAFAKAQLDKRNKDREDFAKLEEEREKALIEKQKELLAEVQTVRDFLESKRVQTEQEQIEAKYARLIEQANGETKLLQDLEMQRQSELSAIKLKALQDEQTQAKAIKDKELADEEAIKDSKIGFAKTTADSLMSIAELVAGNSEANARKLFAVNKALSIAEGVQNTFAGVTAVLSDKTLPTAAKPFAIASVIGIGLANVAKIAATKFGGGGSASGGGRGGSIGSGSATQAAPQPTAAIDFSQLGQTEQTPIPAYILSSSVQSDNEARIRVRDLTTL
jgi:chromosome segregation ATPase